LGFVDFQNALAQKNSAITYA